MNVTSASTILAEMESLGTEQTRKVYKRHGVGDNTFGVSYADLGKFEKKIKTNHGSALDLWASGIHDAQVLACKIADPKQADAATLNQWVQSLNNYVITDAFSHYASKTSVAKQLAEAWIRSDSEWISTAGWNLVAALATTDATLPDTYFEHLLAVIERDLHSSKNRTRHAMNSAVISIGVRNTVLQASAVAVAKRIGKVQVDHGLTNCKTRDAVSYIQKVVDYNTKTKTKAPKTAGKAAKQPNPVKA
jgi:3-methyladenine DNA glycosylase AlkD